MGKKEYWIPELKTGALHRQLRIPMKKKIPMKLLSAIKKAKIGSKIKNPTKVGKKIIKVTRLLKQRAVCAHTLKRLAKRKRKKKGGRRRRRR